VEFVNEKKKIREKCLSQRAQISNTKVSNWSKKIKNKFFDLPQLETAKKVMAYASMRKEIETFELLEELLEKGYFVYLPYTRQDIVDLGTAQINNLDKDLKDGVFGVQEPVAKIRDEEVPVDFDIIIVPGACFTAQGYRIGYGGGYYDSFLAKHANGALKVGFCYDCFIVDSIPVEDHDVPVDLIITEKRIINIK
jgi:5-formyltetrahydrofolate cyclo-ligase